MRRRHKLPQSVLDTVGAVYSRYNANIHRSSHALGREMTELYEQAHANVARFIGAADGREIIFVRNATEAINLVACSLLWGERDPVRLQCGDEIVTTVMEHHSNLVPWQMVRDRIGARLKIADIGDDGRLDLDQMKSLITPKTRLVCCSHLSNVLGTVNPAEEIARMAHAVGALCLVDGAQSVSQMPAHVGEMDCDFLAFSGHKMLAPMGIGVLYGKRTLLEKMTPFLRGGDMIAHVSIEQASWNELPWKFEAGTANLCGGIALGGAVDRSCGRRLEGAVDYLGRLGMERVWEHEQMLTSCALAGLQSMENVRVFGPPEVAGRGGIVSFAVEGADPHVIAKMLDDEGIAVRSGEHYAYPLAARLGVDGTVRVSFHVYNTQREVECFLDVLQDIVSHRLL